MDNLPNGFTGFAHVPGQFEPARAVSREPSGLGSPLSSLAGQGASGAGVAAHASVAGGNNAPVPFSEGLLERIVDADRRWAWVEVDLSAVRHNVAQTRRFLQPRCRLMAVVKADAFGHGAVEVAKAALGAGAERLGVATLPEALALREGGVTAPVQLLTQPPARSIPLLLAHAITPAVYEPDFAVAYGEEADRHAMMAPYHLVLNTGKNDIGVRYDDAVEFLRQVSFHRALEHEGTFTDFATADLSETLDFRIQTKRFTEAVDAIRLAGMNPGLVHAANSAAIYRFPEVHFDMVRLGVALCGIHPCYVTRDLVDLKPAMSVRARIVDVRTVGVSEGVSHGLRYRSPGLVRICTLPLGYADGLRLGLSGNIDFIVGGRYFRQVGEICMDHVMFEVDMRRTPARELYNPQVGDDVIVVGRQGVAEITLDELADKLGTLPHEVAMGFAQRLDRVYV